MLQSIDDWSFDVFAVNAASEGNALKYVGYELLQKYDLISKFKVCTTTRVCRCHSHTQRIQTTDLYINILLES